MLDKINTALQNQNQILPRDREAAMINQDPGVRDRIADQNVTGEKTKKAFGMEECQTCKNRRYQDGSDDPGVSFKSPTKMDPSQAASMVFSHEREHYSRENAKAEENDREVISNTIQVFTDICPECGKAYVSGGETRTVTRKKEEQASFAKDFFENSVGKHKGKEVDQKV